MHIAGEGGGGVEGVPPDDMNTENVRFMDELIYMI